MIILLPSYKRTAILPWVIQSILQCDTHGIDERICILLVNNYFPNKATINNIVAKFDFKDRFCCEVIHREETLLAAESWFNAIFDKAYLNEVFIFLGDDDLMLPWGLKNRYHAIIDHKADMLVSDFYQRIYFSEDGKKYALITDEGIAFENNPKVTIWEYKGSNHARASFVSNHCYRNTGAIKAAFDRAMELSFTQDWVPRAFATGNIPLYMSFTVRNCGGEVLALSEKSVLRGGLVSEIIFQEYSDGCSTAFYSLLLYQMFYSQDLHQDEKIIEDYKALYLKSIQFSIITLLTGRTVSISTILKTVEMAGLKLINLLRPLLMLKGMAILLLRTLPGVRGFRVKRILRKSMLSSTSDLLTWFHAIQNSKSD